MTKYVGGYLSGSNVATIWWMNGSVRCQLVVYCSKVIGVFGTARTCSIFLEGGAEVEVPLGVDEVIELVNETSRQA